MAELSPSSARSDEQRRRYDRQVRLWGASTQQRLESTFLHVEYVSSLGGAAAELAKNMVLSGLGFVSVGGSRKPESGGRSSAAFGSNMLLLSGSDGVEADCSTIVSGLSRLNPYVCVSCATAHESRQRASDHRAAFVNVLSGATLSEVAECFETLQRGLPTTRRATSESGHPTPDASTLLVTVHHFGPLGFATVMHVPQAAEPTGSQNGDHGVSNGQQPARQLGSKHPRSLESSDCVPFACPLPKLVCDKDSLALQHPTLQCVAVCLALADGVKKGVSSDELEAEAVRIATVCGEPLSKDDFARALRWAQDGCGAATCIDSAVLGGVLSQRLTARLGKCAESINEWMLYNVGSGTECLVGTWS